MEIDRELQTYYEQRFSMMATQGWKDLCEDAEKMLNNYQSIDSCSSNEELHFRKGQVDILKWLLNLKAVSEKAWEDLNAEKDF